MIEKMIGKKGVRVGIGSFGGLEYGTTRNGYQWTIAETDPEQLAMLRDAITEYLTSQGSADGKHG